MPWCPAKWAIAKGDLVLRFGHITGTGNHAHQLILRHGQNDKIK